jgi:MerR family transcriptional regulator, light-induced transcriptional regulator
MATYGRELSCALGCLRSDLARRIVALQYEQQPDVWRRYGEAGRVKSVRDAEYHLSYLFEAVAAGSPLLFGEYLAWAKVLFDGLGLPADTLVGTLAATATVLREHLPAKERQAVLDCLQEGIDYLSVVTPVLPSFLLPDLPMASLASAYLEALLRHDRQAASRMVSESIGGGEDIRDVYLHVFQRSQYEIGRLWQMGKVTVAQEHYCTAATQMIISQLYPHLLSAPRIGREAVVACVRGELHEVGARMVADFLEMEGWDTIYLGANTPDGSIVRLVQERRPSLLAVSATMTFHVGAVANLVQAVREVVGRGQKIIVGGYPFNIAPGLWRSMGADGCARDAREAVELGRAMLADEA